MHSMIFTIIFNKSTKWVSKMHTTTTHATRLWSTHQKPVFVPFVRLWSCEDSGKGVGRIEADDAQENLYKEVETRMVQDGEKTKELVRHCAKRLYWQLNNRAQSSNFSSSRHNFPVEHCSPVTGSLSAGLRGGRISKFLKGFSSTRAPTFLTWAVCWVTLAAWRVVSALLAETALRSAAFSSLGWAVWSNSAKRERETRVHGVGGKDNVRNMYRWYCRGS